MIKVGLGQAEGIDTFQTVKASLRKCRQQMQGLTPQAGIVLAGADFDHRQMLAEINWAFPGIELIGCTTAGEFSSNYGFSDDSIVLMVFYSDDIEIKTGVGKNLSKDPIAATNAAMAQARNRMTRDASLCLAFPDGYNRAYEVIMYTLNQGLGSDCPIFGGLAGTLQTGSQSILQFYGKEVLQDALPLMVWGGDIEYAFAIANSWEPIGTKATVTDAEGRVLKRIDGKPAVDFYRYYLGDHAEVAHEFILAVYAEGSDQFYIRAPVAYHDDGSITFTGSIPEGATIELTEAVRSGIFTDTQNSAKRLSTDGAIANPAFALAFSCAFRKDVLGTRAAEELRILTDHLPPNIPLSGFYSYGEIAPLAKGHKSLVHGATLVTLLVGQSKGEPAKDDQKEALNRVAGPLGDAGPSTTQPQDKAALMLESAFLKRKLERSEYYRQRVEEVKERNDTLHHRIIHEIDQARQKIQRKESALRKSEEKYRRIVETAGEGFILMDQNLLIVDVNDAYCQLLGYKREELIGRTPLDLATPEFRQFMIDNREEILAQPQRKIDGTVIAKDGRHIPILIHGSTLLDDRGDIIGNMAFITDMTEHKKALALASEVQKNLLPQSKPPVQGLDVAGRNVSCDEIGGDYFDFLWRRERPDAPFSIAVGDITGHGVDSALLMTSARAFLRLRASQPGSNTEIIESMNRHITHDVLESGRFMTLFYMTIDLARDRISWVRAGHEPALIYDPSSDQFEELKGEGIALGVDGAYDYKENQRTGISDGQIIAIGTDGIWEAYNKQGEMFGKERFRNVIRQHAQENADSLLDAVYGALYKFTQGGKSEDDITLVIVKVNRQEQT